MTEQQRPDEDVEGHARAKPYLEDEESPEDVEGHGRLAQEEGSADDVEGHMPRRPA